MKHFNICLLLCFIINSNSISYSQKITAGIYSGVNFSDIHGQEIGGKWDFKPGPVQGLSFGYSLNKTIGIQTGLSISTVYYEHEYSVPNLPYIDADLITRSYFPGNKMLDFRFLRVPFLFTLSIPSSVKFELRAGLYYSHVLNYNPDYQGYSSWGPDEPVMNDIGYIFSSGISYSFNDSFKATFNGSYLAGRKNFFENFHYRHGATEITLGIAYSGFFHNKNVTVPPENKSDSISSGSILTFFGGVNYSWNKGSTDYSGTTGQVFGLALSFPANGSASFQTGLSFEQKGYSIKDSSSSFYRLIPKALPMYYIDTKVQIDYVIIPALLSLRFGNSGKVFLNTGPWLGLKLNARNTGATYNDNHSGTSYQLMKNVIYDDFVRAVKGYDLGWKFESGISLPVFKGYEVNMSVQYSTGFRNAFDKSGFAGQLYPLEKDLIIKNGSLSFLLGIRIPAANN